MTFKASLLLLSQLILEKVASLVTQTVNKQPAIQETWVWSLGWEDSLEEGMATHSSLLAWRIPMDRGAGGLQLMESQGVRHDWATKHTWLISVIKITSYYWIPELNKIIYLILALQDHHTSTRSWLPEHHIFPSQKKSSFTIHEGSE